MKRFPENRHHQFSVVNVDSFRRVCLLSVIAGALYLGRAEAAIIQENSSDPATPIPVSATDLINQGQSSLLSVVSTATGDYFGYSDYTVLNNGIGGGAYSDAAGNGASPFTVTYTLDTSANSLGYDITGVNTFAASFGFAGVGWQQYELLYSVVGSSGFLSLGTFTFSGDNNYYTKIALTSSEGPIATGVDQVQFVLLSTFSANGTGWTELDVIGVATTAIPEPSTALLLAVAGLGLASVRKRALNARR